MPSPQPPPSAPAGGTASPGAGRPDLGRAFALGIGLNLAYVAVEGTVGLRIGSLGLLADAGHNATDILSLVIAWAGQRIARRAPAGRFTYGFQRTSIVASLFNALLLFGAMGMVAWEALARLREPGAVPGGVIVQVTLVGLVVNFGTAALFLRGREDLNVRAAFLHMLADGIVTLGVLLSGLFMGWYGLPWLDPAVSLVIVVVVLWSTWALFRDALHLSLDAVPAHIELGAVRATLEALPGVVDVHDLHVWALGTAETALTAHLAVAPGRDTNGALLREAREGMARAFGIRHTTIQVEQSGGGACGEGALAPCPPTHTRDASPPQDASPPP